MPHRRYPHHQTAAAFALLSISWLVEDGLAVSEALRRKLAVPRKDLIAALASLTSPERDELKGGILNMSLGSLPGPVRVAELCSYVDSLPLGEVPPAPPAY